ncbi:MAG: hypothetical protein M1820_007515 [Bogoriella megaspora]|nr:MAG: hypothetical protein M1820_007515 [Bogoriella megaspora]
MAAISSGNFYNSTSRLGMIFRVQRRIPYVCKDCTIRSHISTAPITTLSAINKSLRSEGKLPAASKKQTQRPSRPALRDHVREKNAKLREWESARQAKVSAKWGSQGRNEFEQNEQSLGSDGQSTIPRGRAIRRMFNTRADFNRKAKMESVPLSRTRYTNSRLSTTRSAPAERIEYTTAASEFIYGYSAVLSVLKAKRRKPYKLYVHRRLLSRSQSSAHKIIMHLAKHANVRVVHVDTDIWLSLMDEKSENNPHNGVLLEASPLPVVPVLSLQDVHRQQSTFGIEPGYQSLEEKAITGDIHEQKFLASKYRNPFVLFLAGIEDQGNMAAILRTAYFLGVDAVAVVARGTAGVAIATTLKRSSGAAEGLPIFQVENTDSFLTKSAQSGWQIWASVAPSYIGLPNYTFSSVQLSTNTYSPLGFSSKTPSLPSPSNTESSSTSLMPSNPPSIVPSPPPSLPSNSLSNLIKPPGPSSTHLTPQPHTSLRAPTCDAPCILMLGGEMSGLPRSTIAKAQRLVTITNEREEDEIGVDSLNVGVAAGLLIQAFIGGAKERTRGGLGARLGGV